MSMLYNKIFWQLLALLSSIIELTESLTCRRFPDLVYLKLSVNYYIRELFFILCAPCLMCIVNHMTSTKWIPCNFF